MPEVYFINVHVIKVSLEDYFVIVSPKERKTFYLILELMKLNTSFGVLFISMSLRTENRLSGKGV